MTPRLSVTTAVLVLASAAPARADDAAVSGRAAFDEGVSAYAAGHYAQAVTAFEKAYQESRAPALLFNIAQAYRLWGAAHCWEARDNYQRYLALDPQAPNRDEVQTRLDGLSACPAQRPAPAATAVTATQPAPRASPWPWKPVLVAGGAVALAGGGLYAASLAKYDSLKPQCPCPASAYNGWPAATTVSYIAAAVGGAAVLTGLGLWWASPRPSEVTLSVGPGAIGLRGRF